MDLIRSEVAMKVTIDLPDRLTDEVQKQGGDLSQWILSHLLLDAMKGGLITFDEFRESLSFYSEEDLHRFFLTRRHHSCVLFHK